MGKRERERERDSTQNECICVVLEQKSTLEKRATKNINTTTTAPDE